MPKLPPRTGVNPYTEAAQRPAPPRVSKDYEPTHCYSDGNGGVWTHAGRSVDCRKPECVQWHREQQKDRPPLLPPETAPWGYSEEHVESWQESDPPPDALAPCPKYGGKHRWRWGDDGNGHSGDVCACGAFEE